MLEPPPQLNIGEEDWEATVDLEFLRRVSAELERTLAGRAPEDWPLPLLTCFLARGLEGVGRLDQCEQSEALELIDLWATRLGSVAWEGGDIPDSFPNLARMR